jgi:hypothetical protein
LTSARRRGKRRFGVPRFQFGRSVAAIAALFLAVALIELSAGGGGPVPAGAAAKAATTIPGPNCSATSVGLTPLTDLGQRTYKGVQGGLYPGGVNTPPTSYLNAGLTAAGQVRPLASTGAPSPSGRIVLLSIGMSNASSEYTQLIQQAATQLTIVDHRTVGGVLSKGNSHVTLVDGATPSFDAKKIVRNQASYLSIVDADLADTGVTPNQVQAVWLKEAIAGENEAFPTDSQRLESDLNTIIAMLKTHFPSLRLVYLSSRIYAGYATVQLSPEPFAYDGGFAVKATVADAMATPTARPWVGWGPYLWANGTHPRSDGVEWLCSDFASDGTHPSTQGAQKVAGLLLHFFSTDPTTKTWFNAQ